MIYDANQEQIELDKMKQALQQVHKKCRDEAEVLIKTHKLDQVSDMVLECLIDELMLERDGRTYAYEVETDFYRGLIK
jgi:hypothetical protein